MARPPKKNGDAKRELIFRFRITHDEKTRLASLAKEQGFRTESDFVRSRTLESKPVQSPLLPDRELLIRSIAQLGKIGSNVNQIARNINIRMKTGEAIGVSSELISHALHGVESVTRHLFRILKDGHFRKTAR